MFPTNHLYGNAQILAAYAGLPQPLYPPTIAGYVQPWLDSECPSFAEAQDVTAFIWGPAARRRRHMAGLRNDSPIGAPWLYLLDLAERNRIPRAPIPAEDRTPLPESGDVLYFPHHGLAGEHAASARASQLAKRTAHDTITVALTHEQAASDATRQAYEAAGARVIDLGLTSDEVGTVEPFYLERLLYLMKAHRQVEADELNAFAIFAHAAEIPVAIPGTDPATLEQRTRDELGTDYVMPPPELRALFDWSSHV